MQRDNDHEITPLNPVRGPYVDRPYIHEEPSGKAATAKKTGTADDAVWRSNNFLDLAPEIREPEPSSAPSDLTPATTPSSSFLKLTADPTACPSSPSSTMAEPALSSAASTTSEINAASAADGFSRIDVLAFMGDHICSDSEMAKRCLVGGWASLMNMGRKGDAETLRKMGETIFGEDTFGRAVKEALFAKE